MMQRSKFGSVYRITCAVTGKVYIGLTRDYVSNRWHQHRKAARTGVSSALYQAMRKHGPEHFSIETIASSLDPQALADLERALIEQHDAYGRCGYNMSKGGESHIERRMTEEGKARLKAARNRDADRAANSARNAERMRSKAGKAHHALMVEAARKSGAKLSAARKAYAATEAGAAQISKAAKMGAARKAELSSKPVMAEGRRFASIKEAADTFGIERGAIRYRIKSPNFESWSWA